MQRRRNTGSAIAAAASLCLLSACSGHGDSETYDTPSKMKIPRWVSLKFSDVNARSGPGEDYPLALTYHIRGLPVQIVSETSEWRRICDPDGRVVWVHKRMLEGRRMVLRLSSVPLELRASPNADASIAARLIGRSLAALRRCEGGWCQVEAGGVSGYAPETELFGASETVACQTPPYGAPAAVASDAAPASRDPS